MIGSEVIALYRRDGQMGEFGKEGGIKTWRVRYQRLPRLVFY